MAYYRDLAAVLRGNGHKVVEVDGWQDRTTAGHPSGFLLQGWVVHHTGPWGSGIVDALRNGRPDLAGPLAQLGFNPYTLTWYVVAAGRANHNGYGFYVPWCPWGNDAAGIEVFNTGTDPVPEDGYEELVAGLVTLTGHYHVFGIAGHKETDPNRKWDPGTIDMAQFRTDVVAGGTVDDMPTPQELKTWVTDPIVTAIEKDIAHRQAVHDSLVKRLGVSSKEADANLTIADLLANLASDA